MSTTPRAVTISYWKRLVSQSIVRESELWDRLDECISAEKVAKEVGDDHALQVVRRRLKRTREQYTESLKWRNMVLPILRELTLNLKWTVSEDTRLQAGK